MRIKAAVSYSVSGNFIYSFLKSNRDSTTSSGAHAAFSAGGGGVHFKLERTSCQHSLKYISLYNAEGAPLSSEKRNMFLCD